MSLIASFVLVAYGGFFNGTSGNVTSPNYPDSYPGLQDITWYITVPMGSIVRADFVNFSLEGSDTCSYDYVEVRYHSNASD